MKTVYVANVTGQCVVAGNDEKEARRAVIHNLMDFMEYDSDIELSPLTKDNIPDGYEDWCSPYNGDVTIGKYLCSKTIAHLKDIAAQIYQHKAAIDRLEDERLQLEREL
jgi:hypothetical protein